MYRLTIFLMLLIFPCSAQISSVDKSVATTPVDVFPLAIGNQWIYNYFYGYEEPGGVVYSRYDTGTVHLQIINKIESIDSVRWLVQQSSSIWIIWTGFLSSEPTVKTDTFEIVEYKVGNHQLYRPGTVSSMEFSIPPYYS